VKVRNVHRRTIDVPDELGSLLDGLSSDDDRLWPKDRWPRMRLDGPLQVGARGGHGPVRYRVEDYDPGRRVRFRFERPHGFRGFHEFHVVTGDDQPAELVHILEARMTGAARLTWPLFFRPLHDAVIEDALDNAERIAGDLVHPQRWSAYVRFCRRAAAAIRR
jgi:hypothetical protein